LIETELSELAAEADVYVIDEIGKMECLSGAFIVSVSRAFASSVPVLATVAAKGSGFIAEVKARDDVEILRVTPANRDELPATLVRRLQRS